MIDKSDQSELLQNNVSATSYINEDPSANSFIQDTTPRIHTMNRLSNSNAIRGLSNFFECAVCCDILSEPVKCYNCGTHMCRTCSNKFIKGTCISKACTGFEPQVADRTRLDILASLKFKCKYMHIHQDKSTMNKDECNNVSQDELQGHEETCKLKFPIKCGTCQIDCDEEIHSQNSIECLSMQLNFILKQVARGFIALLSSNKEECERLNNLSNEILCSDNKSNIRNFCRTHNNYNTPKNTNTQPEFVSHLEQVGLICHGNAYINNYTFTKIVDDAWDTQVRLNKELTKGTHVLEVTLVDLKFDDGGSIFVGFKRWEDTGTSYKPNDFVGQYFYTDINTCEDWLEAKPWVNDSITVTADLDKKETRQYKGDLLIGRGDLSKLGNGYVQAFVILLYWNGDQILLKDQKILIT